MGVQVSPMIFTGAKGQEWYYLVADTEDELHTMAAAIGKKREHFKPGLRYVPYYPILGFQKGKAIRRGAVELSTSMWNTLVQSRKWQRQANGEAVNVR